MVKPLKKYQLRVKSNSMMAKNSIVNRILLYGYEDLYDSQPYNSSETFVVFRLQSNP